MTARCKTCGAPVNLAPDGDPRYERPACWTCPRLKAAVVAMREAFARLKEMVENPGSMEHGEIAYVINRALDLADEAVPNG